MKRYLIAGAVGTMVFGAALGSAAALGVNGNPVAQYGEDMNLVCDPDGITVDGFFLDSEPPSVSNGVVLSDIHEDCVGKTIVATITDEDGDMIKRAFGPVTAAGSKTLSWDAAVPVSDIYGVQLTLG